MAKKIKIAKKRSTRKFSFKNIKIGWKYGFIVMIMLAMFAISTSLVSVLLTGVGNDIEEVENKGNHAIQITEMGSLTRSKAIRIVNYLQEQNPLLIEEFNTRGEEFNELEATLRETLDTDEQKEIINQVASMDEELNELFATMRTNVNTDDIISAENNVFAANKVRTEMIDLLEELRVTVNEERTAAVNDAKESQALTFMIQIVSFAISTFIGVSLVIFISRRISKNLTKLVDISENIADGNLAVEKLDYNGKDEIGKLGNAVHTMSTNLRRMIQQVTNVSETVTSQSEELTQSANEVKAGTEQVATTMQELAAGSETQANSASSLAEVMSTFSTKVKDTNENGVLISENSNNVLSMTNNGTEIMKSTTSQMKKIDQIVQEAVLKVKGLDEQSQKITSLVTVIKDVADQTNLLALNAAIEAARAGEHGKGFAVVADEVRKLAEQVSVSVTDITGIVTTIQTESSDVANTLQGGYKEVEEGSSQIEITNETFANIADAVTNMATNINTVTTNLAEIDERTKDMNLSIEEIASISEQSAAGVEETTASTEQASSTMEEVAGSSDQLAKLAEELNQLVRQFRL
ncbi:methyl-accepting chemotaxis protein [Ornithinibacillus halophilus]|uniref:Methyl-accepting chemotaxis protein n=1 Tax=Ornithinibacillus halophilus TaxID=930117 RepID=A0A1M5FF84_9BACI|nr:HAMP domain-containing methyl-accepting chemotaxis protein [Ornithinibacillus halophilus]SHF90227.1 methyl-accepting chemotaxis protein [Ornithinibacillus halophilus]